MSQVCGQSLCRSVEDSSSLIHLQKIPSVSEDSPRVDPHAPFPPSTVDEALADVFHKRFMSEILRTGGTAQMDAILHLASLGRQPPPPPSDNGQLVFLNPVAWEGTNCPPPPPLSHPSVLSDPVSSMLDVEGFSPIPPPDLYHFNDTPVDTLFAEEEDETTRQLLEKISESQKKRRSNAKWREGMGLQSVTKPRTRAKMADRLADHFSGWARKTNAASKRRALDAIQRGEGEHVFQTEFGWTPVRLKWQRRRAEWADCEPVLKKILEEQLGREGEEEEDYDDEEEEEVVVTEEYPPSTEFSPYAFLGPLDILDFDPDLYL